jgi:hypothetical protein
MSEHSPSAFRPHLFGAAPPPVYGGEEHRHATTRNPWQDPLFVPGMRNGCRASELARIAALIAYVDSRDLGAEERLIVDTLAGAVKGRPVEEGVPNCAVCGKRCPRRARRFCSRTCYRACKEEASMGLRKGARLG